MNKEAIFNYIVKSTYEVIPDLVNQDIKQTDCLKELGADSVDRAEIIMMVMEKLGLQIPRIELFGAKNIEDLVNVFYEKYE